MHCHENKYVFAARYHRDFLTTLVRDTSILQYSRGFEQESRHVPGINVEIRMTLESMRRTRYPFDVYRIFSTNFQFSSKRHYTAHVRQTLETRDDILLHLGATAENFANVRLYSRP